MGTDYPETYPGAVDPSNLAGGVAGGEATPPTEAEGLAGAPSPEELAERKLDHEADERTVAELLVPGGSYVTMGGSQVREMTFNERDGGKRLVFAVTSNITNSRDITQKLGKDEVKVYPAGSIEDSIDFRFSHQRRNRDDGEPDGAHKRYLQLKAAYKQANGGELPKYVSDIVRFVEQNALALRITQFEGQNFVVNISMVRV